MNAAPPIPLDKVEWRVDSDPNVDRDGKVRCRFVPYLDARDVAALLDEWVGVANWSDEYENGVIDGKFGLWCHLSVWDDDHERWVKKSDIGVPSNMEPQKGCVSDAFKRAATAKWGVGRNVYDLPTLRALCGTYKNKRGQEVAAASKDTLPDILRQLKARGFDASGGRVRDHDDEEAPNAQPNANQHASSERATSGETGGATRGDHAARAVVNGNGGEAAPTGQSSPVGAASSEHHDLIRHLIEQLAPPQKSELMAWWAERHLPSIKDSDALTEADAKAVEARLEELLERV